MTLLINGNCDISYCLRPKIVCQVDSNGLLISDDADHLSPLEIAWKTNKVTTMKWVNQCSEAPPAGIQTLIFSTIDNFSDIHLNHLRTRPNGHSATV